MKKTIFLLAAVCLLTAGCQPRTEVWLNEDDPELYACEKNSDCSLINRVMECPSCACDEMDLGSDHYVAANDVRFRQAIGAWQKKNCPNYDAILGCPECLPKVLNAHYQAGCVNNHCVKIDTAATSDCVTAGGTQSALWECDGSESAVCTLPSGETCYLENLKKGVCVGVFSPKVLCD